MTLASLVKTGPAAEPVRLILQGVEGIGKTTFASKAPGVLFLTPEDGGGDLDTTRLVVESWKDVLSRVRMLLDEPHEYRVLALDTINALERLCQAHLVAEAHVATIEDVGGGYGKGYTRSTEAQAELVRMLDELREKRRMHILALAHTEIRTFADPEGASYDRYQLRMHKSAVGLWTGWADAVLFANYDVQVKTEKGSGDAALLRKGKASTKAPERVLYTERRAAFDAKNRYNLPPELPLSWDEFAGAMRWDERDRAVLASAPPAKAPSVEDVRAAIGHALRELDWINEEVAALLSEHGATKAHELPESDRAAVLAALRVSHTKSKE